MTARSVTTRGQTAARALMTDAGRIVRLGAPVTDPNTGEVTIPETELYAGPLRVRPDVGSTDVEAGEVRVGQLGYLVSVPLSVAGIEFHDVVDVTASVDPQLVGRRLVVTGIAAGTHVTARRLRCELESP